MLVTNGAESTYRPGYETIAAKIVELIKDASLQPGARLPTEQQLAEQLGVSRAMVREAVKILTARGHVRTRRGSGIYVSDGAKPFATAAIHLSMPVDVEHMRALFEFRCMQEMLTVRLAIQHITLVELRALEKIVALNRQAAEAGQWEPFMESDNDFHNTIARASHNPFLAETVETVLRLQRWTVKMVTGGAPGSLLRSADQHIAIFSALKDGVVDNAVQEIKNHIEVVLQEYLQDVRRRLLLEDQPDGSTAEKK
ncbi:MAG TPA: FadR/GntR family transcriptional regulator [Ktedonosporobacter sp.]|nr:FadR/GntR family transcriptional regulator [Ktedonosporobacter sp.]